MARNKKSDGFVYGDYQTPIELARSVVTLLRAKNFAPKTILEPTMGLGHFLEAAGERLKTVQSLIGIEINADYVAYAKAQLAKFARRGLSIEIHQADVFKFDLRKTVRRCHQPILVLGNPPWVTAAAQATAARQNMPKKRT